MNSSFKDVSTHDPQNFLQALVGHGSTASTQGNSLFRGVGHAERYPLVPSAWRRTTEGGYVTAPPKGSTPNSADDRQRHRAVLNRERHALKLFYIAANQQGIPFPQMGSAAHDFLTNFDEAPYLALPRPPEEDFPEPDLLALLAIAQHNGVPTRLLDFSFDPLVAAYFAATSAMRLIATGGQNFDMAVWVISNDLEMHQRRLMAIVNRTDPQMKAVNFPRVHTVQAVNNLYLGAQRGAFMFIRETDLQAAPPKYSLNEHYQHQRAQLADLWLKTTAEPPQPPAPPMLEGDSYFTRVRLSGTLAPDLMRTLSKQGYNGARMFPGLKGCAAATLEDLSLQ